MLKKSAGGSGGSGGGGGGGGSAKSGKLEAGVAEINNSLCSAMFGLVLSDEALRLHQLDTFNKYYGKDYCRDFQARRQSTNLQPDKKVTI